MDWQKILLWWMQEKLRVEWRIGPVGERKGAVVETYRKQKSNKPGEVDIMLIMTVTQECPLEVKFKDSKGNEAVVENIVWSSSDEGIVKVNANDAEPNKAIAVSVSVGTAQVNVKADARVGEGSNEIVGLMDVQVLAAEATVVEISAGTPVETPHVEPQTGRSKK